VKCHLMCGVKTNVVTAVEIGDREANDAPFLPKLVESTARNFKIAEFSADKAYGSRNNAGAIEKAGGTPFIALKRLADRHGNALRNGHRAVRVRSAARCPRGSCRLGGLAAEHCVRIGKAYPATGQLIAVNQV
jgi:hypothetical protein